MNGKEIKQWILHPCKAIASLEHSLHKHHKAAATVSSHIITKQLKQCMVMLRNADTKSDEQK